MLPVPDITDSSLEDWGVELKGVIASGDGNVVEDNRRRPTGSSSGGGSDGGSPRSREDCDIPDTNDDQRNANHQLTSSKITTDNSNHIEEQSASACLE